MRNDYIHITLVIDESGSMTASKSNVIDGVQKIIDEQKKNNNGKCSISLYTFNDNVKEEFVGIDVNDLPKFEYNPNSLTAMNDGIGIAIDKTGKWLSDMNEEDRPGKVLVAIFTDGFENASKEYTLDKVKEMISHQETKYSWTFIYLGMDITTKETANNLGISTASYTSKKLQGEHYKLINCSVNAWRSMANSNASLGESNDALYAVINEEADKNTKIYEKEIGRKIS